MKYQVILAVKLIFAAYLVGKSVDKNISAVIKFIGV